MNDLTIERLQRLTAIRGGSGDESAVALALYEELKDAADEIRIDAFGNLIATRYGTEDPDLIARPALHSCALTLVHPVTEEKMEFTASFPEDFINAMNLLAETE